MSSRTTGLRFSFPSAAFEYQEGRQPPGQAGMMFCARRTPLLQPVVKPDEAAVPRPKRSARVAIVTMSADPAQPGTLKLLTLESR